MVNVAQAALVHLGVDLGGADVGVPQHFLNGSERGTVGKQVTGKAMTKCMWMDGGEDARFSSVFPNDLPDAGPGKGPSAVGQKNLPCVFMRAEQGWPDLVKILLD